MAKNYTITFRSLRGTGIIYTLSIGGGTGTAVALKGGAKPFTTQEDNSEDMFTPVRTQSGYIRIVDDGYAADGTTAFDWKDLIPATDTSRPVTLTHVEGNTTIVDWQGFMQAQTFNGVLYGNPQEREFPVQCVLSVLSATQVRTTETVYRNFAYLLDYIFGTIPTHTITSLVFQGGVDARAWLRKKFDWRNLLNVNDGDISPRYNLYEVLEDVCRYWGWTARTYRQTVYFTCIDDASEPNALVLTPTQLYNLGNGSTSAEGSVSTMKQTVTVGDFASTDNDDIQLRGYNKAIVKADANATTSELAFAPQSVRDMMEQGGYTWVGNPDPDEEMIGYFTTPQIQTFTASGVRAMEGGANTYTVGGFVRRQIYSEEDQSSPTIVDEIVLKQPNNNVAKVWLESAYEMSFPGGSFEMKGTLYEGWKQTDVEGSWNRRIKMAIGIGPSRGSSSTRWLKLSAAQTWMDLAVTWETTKTIFDVMLTNMPTLCPAYYSGYTILIAPPSLKRIPVPADLSGRVFIEFYGAPDEDGQRIGQPQQCNFEIADFSLTFSRDAVTVQAGRERNAIKTRYGSREYEATNNNLASEQYNVDSIYAADNDLDYGYGLLMNADGSFMSTAPYSAGTVNQYPEQHLANRIATYWQTARRMMSLELQSQATDVTPRSVATINQTTLYPISISRDWRDDVTQLMMIEI